MYVSRSIFVLPANDMPRAFCAVGCICPNPHLDHRHNRLFFRQCPDVSQHVDRVLWRESGKTYHFDAWVPVAYFVQNFPRIRIGFGTDIPRLVALTPIKCSAVKAVARGAGRLECCRATCRVTFDLASVEINHRIHVHKPLGQEGREVFELFLWYHLFAVTMCIGTQDRSQLDCSAGIPKYTGNTGLVGARAIFTINTSIVPTVAGFATCSDCAALLGIAGWPRGMRVFGPIQALRLVPVVVEPPAAGSFDQTATSKSCRERRSKRCASSV